MKQRTAQWLIKLYPKTWRSRFGQELADLLEHETLSLAVLLDVLRAASAERLFNSYGLEIAAMATYPSSVLVLARRPSAFVPIVMSLAALVLVLGTVATFGVVHEADEGAAAHVFQLLIAGEMPVLAFFVVRWLRQDLRAGLTMLGAQVAALGAALFPVWYLGL